jgi:hypothetical protein
VHLEQQTRPSAYRSDGDGFVWALRDDHVGIEPPHFLAHEQRQERIERDKDAIRDETEALVLLLARTPSREDADVELLRDCIPLARECLVERK